MHSRHALVEFTTWIVFNSHNLATQVSRRLPTSIPASDPPMIVDPLDQVGDRPECDRLVRETVAVSLDGGLERGSSETPLELAKRYESKHSVVAYICPFKSTVLYRSFPFSHAACEDLQSQTRSRSGIGGGLCCCCARRAFCCFLLRLLCAMAVESEGYASGCDAATGLI